MNDIYKNLEVKIVEATAEVFSTMVMMEIRSLPAGTRETESIESNLTSMLGLGGEIRGMLAIHCPGGVAKDITSSFLGMEVKELDEDVEDAIGEVANMIGGSLKTYFASKEINIELAIPSSIIGKSFRTSGLFGASQLIIPFLCGQEKFWVELKYVLNT